MEKLHQFVLIVSPGCIRCRYTIQIPDVIPDNVKVKANKILKRTEFIFTDSGDSLATLVAFCKVMEWNIDDSAALAQFAESKKPVTKSMGVKPTDSPAPKPEVDPEKSSNETKPISPEPEQQWTAENTIDELRKHIISLYTGRLTCQMDLNIPNSPNIKVVTNKRTRTHDITFKKSMNDSCDTIEEFCLLMNWTLPDHHILEAFVTAKEQQTIPTWMTIDDINREIEREQMKLDVMTKVNEYRQAVMDEAKRINIKLREELQARRLNE